MQSSVSLTPALVPRLEGPLAVVGDVEDLLHAPHLLYLFGDLFAEARDVRLLPHSAARCRRRDLGLRREHLVLLALPDHVLPVPVAAPGQRCPCNSKDKQKTQK